jgi:hypothetical protein
MHNRLRLVVVSLAGCLALASVAFAKPPHNTGTTGNKCSPHKVAYIATGTLMSWSASAGTDGKYSGPVSVTVAKANHHAANAKGNTVPFTLGGTKLELGKGLTKPLAGDHVKVIGKITEIAKTCTNQSGAGTVTVRTIRVTAH